MDVNIIKRRSHIILCCEVRVFSAEDLVVLHNWEVLHARSDDVLDLWGIVLGLEPTAFCLLGNEMLLVMVLVIHVNGDKFKI